jgi:hypothetical protein
VIALAVAGLLALQFLLLPLLLEQTFVVSPPPPPPEAPLVLQFAGPSCPGWSNEDLGIPIVGGTVWMEFTLIVRAAAGSCTAESVAIPTPGFTLLTSNTPLVVSAGSYGSLDVNVSTPSEIPIGNVTFVVYVGAVTATSAVAGETPS